MVIHDKPIANGYRIVVTIVSCTSENQDTITVLAHIFIVEQRGVVLACFYGPWRMDASGICLKYTDPKKYRLGRLGLWWYVDRWLTVVVVVTVVVVCELGRIWFSASRGAGRGRGGGMGPVGHAGCGLPS